MKARIVLNPAAGPTDFHRHLQRAVAYLETAGWEVDVQPTERQGDGITLARQAAEAGYNVVIAVGGDGTINEVVNGIAGSETALGVIPAGTANVYAADVGIPIWSPLRPMAVREAAKIINTGKRLSIDLGRVKFSNGRQRYFFMWCGIGLDAAVTKEVNTAQTRRLGVLAWVIAGTMVAIKYMGHSSRITIDNAKEQKRMLVAVVSNGQLYGRVLRIAPDAKMDDGVLNLTVFEGYGVLSTVRHLASLLLGRYARDPTLHQYTGRRISIRTRRPLPVHLDAEPLGTTPIQIEVVPQSLNVIWPANLPAHLLTGVKNQGPGRLLSAWGQTPEEIAQKIRERVKLRMSEILKDLPGSST